ncbi:unnamed protein product [marine sediment metagenome]|uniref:Uncharacterized protein n=1 Tax=marine sediment metagenome TaxID=412755 RepID=X0WAP0_9ZZZZ
MRRKDFLKSLLITPLIPVVAKGDNMELEEYALSIHVACNKKGTMKKRNIENAHDTLKHFGLNQDKEKNYDVKKTLGDVQCLHPDYHRRLLTYSWKQEKRKNK